MHRYAPAFCFAALVVLNFGCGGSSKKSAAPTATVKGVVNLDGHPMATGEITFSIPGEGVKQMPIKDGTFSGEASEGKNKVEIALYKDGPPDTTKPTGPPTKVNVLPARWNTESKLTADVTVGGANDFKFDITK
jgi:hypothetical protein